MKSQNGNLNSLNTISFYFSQEMARKNVLTSWENCLSPEIAKELQSICEEFDVKPVASGTKSGSPNPSNGEWWDYLLFEMVFQKKAPRLTEMIEEISKCLPIPEDELMHYDGCYFIGSKYHYARLLPGGIFLCNEESQTIAAGDELLMRGKTFGQSCVYEEEKMRYVGVNFEPKITFESVLHEIFHIKLQKTEDRCFAQSENWFDERIKEIAEGIHLPLEKSIWNWPGIKEEHESLGKVFKNLADKIEPNLERWKVNPKRPNL